MTNENADPIEVITSGLIPKIGEGLDAVAFQSEMQQALKDGVSASLLTALFSNLQYYDVQFFYDLLPRYREALNDVGAFNRNSAFKSTLLNGASGNWITALVYPEAKVYYDDDIIPENIKQLVGMDDHAISGATLSDAVLFNSIREKRIAIVANYTSRALNLFHKRGINCVTLGNRIPILHEVLTPIQVEELLQVNKFYLEQDEDRLGLFEEEVTDSTVAYFTSYRIPDNLPVFLAKVLTNSVRIKEEYTRRY